MFLQEVVLVHAQLEGDGQQQHRAGRSGQQQHRRSERQQAGGGPQEQQQEQAEQVRRRHVERDEQAGREPGVVEQKGEALANRLAERIGHPSDEREERLQGQQPEHGRPAEQSECDQADGRLGVDGQRDHQQEQEDRRVDDHHQKGGKPARADGVDEDPPLGGLVVGQLAGDRSGSHGEHRERGRADHQDREVGKLRLGYRAEQEAGAADDQHVPQVQGEDAEQVVPHVEERLFDQKREHVRAQCNRG